MATEQDDCAFDIHEQIIGLNAFIGGTANVILQLSRRPVAYGVMDSPVSAGNVMHRPFKRLRTTLTYLAVALLGTDEERLAYRQAVDQVHRLVRSRPDDPVRYNAFDPQLQLWVAACLYFGFVDLLEKLRGPMDEASADAFYRHSARLGTTLQMRERDWPANRQAFTEYWQTNLRADEIDARTAAFFHGLIELRMLPAPVRWMLAPGHRFVVTGCLPGELRERLQLPWDARRQRRFEGLMRSLGWLLDQLPRTLRQFPLNYYLWDLRRRLRRGQPLV
jgi:uncharacterized protein (DUF2236 family)